MYIVGNRTFICTIREIKRKGSIDELLWCSIASTNTFYIDSILFYPATHNKHLQLLLFKSKKLSLAFQWNWYSLNTDRKEHPKIMNSHTNRNTGNVYIPVSQHDVGVTVFTLTVPVLLHQRSIFTIKDYLVMFETKIFENP